MLVTQEGLYSLVFVSYLVSWFVSKLVGWSVSQFVVGKDRSGFILISRYSVHVSRGVHPVSCVRGFRIYFNAVKAIGRNTNQFVLAHL